MGNILTGKKIVVMGVANKRSIAWGCAQMMAEQGAQVDRKSTRLNSSHP